jgi:hypothetical protein
MRGRKSIFIEQTQDLILTYYRQTGDLKNSALRAGMSERSFFRWKERCEKAQSGPLHSFWQEYQRAKGERCSVVRGRHFQRAQGGIFAVPVCDKNGTPVRDAEGKLEMREKYFEPDLKAMRWELAILDPQTYGSEEERAATLPEPPAKKPNTRSLADMLTAAIRRQHLIEHPNCPCYAIETTATPVNPAGEHERTDQHDGHHGTEQQPTESSGN